MVMRVVLAAVARLEQRDELVERQHGERLGGPVAHDEQPRAAP
jgi:hypothetical protein